MGKQGIQGLLGVDGPPVSYNRYTSASVSANAHVTPIFIQTYHVKQIFISYLKNIANSDTIPYNLACWTSSVRAHTREILNLIKCNWMNWICQLTFYVVFFLHLRHFQRSRLTFKMRTTDLLTRRLFSSQGINFFVESNTFAWVSHCSAELCVTMIPEGASSLCDTFSHLLIAFRKFC